MANVTLDHDRDPHYQRWPTNRKTVRKRRFTAAQGVRETAKQARNVASQPPKVPDKPHYRHGRLVALPSQLTYCVTVMVDLIGHLFVGRDPRSSRG